MLLHVHIKLCTRHLESDIRCWDWDRGLLWTEYLISQPRHCPQSTCHPDIYATITIFLSSNQHLTAAASSNETTQLFSVTHYQQARPGVRREKRGQQRHNSNCLLIQAIRIHFPCHSAWTNERYPAGTGCGHILSCLEVSLQCRTWIRQTGRTNHTSHRPLASLGRKSEHRPLCSLTNNLGKWSAQLTPETVRCRR